MGCLDGNCEGQICKPDLISPHMPPKRTGWKLVGWPDFVPDAFRDKFGHSPVWNGNDHSQVIQQIVHVLKSNGIAVDNDALCQWANAQWCAADPARCRSSQPKGSKLMAEKNRGLVGDTMQWATAFWQLWNVAVSDRNRPDSQVRATMEGFIETARHLLTGQSGCSKCARHFGELLEAYPVEKAGTWREARVWLWNVHNQSRDSKKIVPYVKIAEIYGWDSLPAAEVAQIVEALKA